MLFDPLTLTQAYCKDCDGYLKTSVICFEVTFFLTVCMSQSVSYTKVVVFGVSFEEPESVHCGGCMPVLQLIFHMEVYSQHMLPCFYAALLSLSERKTVLIMKYFSSLG